MSEKSAFVIDFSLPLTLHCSASYLSNEHHEGISKYINGRLVLVRSRMYFKVYGMIYIEMILKALLA